MSIPCYQQSETAFFDFWIDRGDVFPDWDESCYVEFRDAAGELRFTATISSSPALTKDTDRAGRKFVYVQGIELGQFALGDAEAKIYAQVEGVQVLPHPTLIAPAFTVVPDLGGLPLYTTVDRVCDELPGGLPSVLTAEKIARYIADASRFIDAQLAGLYATPFPGIGEQPATPALIERIARLLASHDCRCFLGLVNDERPGQWAYEQAQALLASLRSSAERTPLAKVADLAVRPLYVSEIHTAAEGQQPLLE